MELRCFAFWCRVQKSNRGYSLTGAASFLRRRACSPPCRWPWSNPESVDASPLRGPRLSGDRVEVRPRAVQLFVHQHQLDQLLQRGSVQPSSEDHAHPGEYHQERERSVRLVLDREIDQDIVRRRPRELSLLLRIHRFRSFARRHQLPPLLLPRLNPPLADRVSALIDLDDLSDSLHRAIFRWYRKRHRGSAVSQRARREWYIISVVKRRRPAIRGTSVPHWRTHRHERHKHVLRY